MHTCFRVVLALATCMIFCATLASSAEAAAKTKTTATANTGGSEALEFGAFGSVRIYRNAPQPKHVVLFVSGDGGWNLGVVDMARALTELDAIVVGIDITHYLKVLENSSASCSYPAADLEALSQYLQKKLGYRDYALPVLVGYSSGATLVYAVLAQAPPNTFRGGLSLGFCPDLDIKKTMCKGQGLAWEPGPKGKGVNFLPSAQLQTPLIVFQGEIDQVCDAPGTVRFVQQTRNAQLVSLPKVGHGYSVQKNWMPQFKQSFQQLTSAATPAKVPAQLDDLPLIEVPVTSNSDAFAVILSGDGGWASLDRELAGAITAQGIPVVGWDSLHYYWTRRTPEEAAGDLQRIVRHYAEVWHKKKMMLIGFSRGADVLPFLVNRLAASEKQRVSQVVLLGLSSRVDFEFKVTDWLPSAGEGSHDVIAESNLLQGLSVLCIYGADEKDSGCRKVDRNHLTVSELPGGHHFGGNYAGVADMILSHHEKVP